MATEGRDALAEQDEGKRSSMLRGAGRFLKGSKQRSLTLLSVNLHSQL